jgi:PKD repeat protein
MPFERFNPVVVATLLLAACGGSDLVLPGDQPTGGASIQLVGGSGQSGQVGSLVADPVIVEVTDTSGQPVEGATVAFELAAAGAGADMVPRSAVTDANGRASARILLGDKVGLQTGEARLVLDKTIAARTSFTVIALSPGAGNSAPRADFNWHCEELDCHFTDASTDDDGSVVDWNWSFGDGGASGEKDPGHRYPGPGSYTVTLTVADNVGATDVSQTQVTVSAPSPAPNTAPHAEFEVHCHGLTCSFRDTSTDQDGSITGWSWQFGDGTPTATEQNPTHTYPTAGHYDVGLTVTDNAGASDFKTHRADPQP